MKTILSIAIILSPIILYGQWIEDSGVKVKYERNSTGLIVCLESNSLGTHLMSGQSLNLIFNSNNIGTDKFTVRMNGETSSTSTEVFTILGSNQNVGIGITNPAYKLDVDGIVRAEEIKVQSVEGADFVFEEDYDLSTLQETEAYIISNKHLPGIPSAKAMKEEGIRLAEMNILLLQKIEEMTLHLIEIKKENEAMKSEIEILKQQN